MSRISPLDIQGLSPEDSARDDRPVLFVGDVQGCAHEMGLLLERARFVPGRHRLIPVGDLVNRGPDAAGVLNILREVHAEPILGNHELGLLEMSRNGRVHPWARRPEYAYTQLKAAGCWEEAMAGIAQWPLFRRGAGWMVVHAGIHPRLRLEDTPRDFLTEVRYCDESGRRPDHWDKNQSEPPPGFRPWYEHYRGEEVVIFGHWAQKGLIREGRVRGLDTGCVYGKQLTGLWWPQDSLVQVPASKVYYPVREPMKASERK